MQNPEILDAAVQFHQSGNLPEAEKRYRQILAQQPEHADANHLLGLLAYQGKFYSQAADLIRRAISTDGSRSAYHNSLGLVLKETGATDQSLNSFRRALELDAHNGEALVNLARLNLQLENYDEALNLYGSLLSRQPDNTEALGNMGIVFNTTGQYQEAINCFQKLISIHPTNAEAHSNLGVAYHKSGDQTMAHKAYLAALSEAPDHLETLINLGLLFQEMGQLDAAQRHFEKACEVAPNSADAVANLGVVFQLKARPKKSLQVLQEAIELDPGHAKAHANLGTAYLELGYPQKASDCFQQALNLNPDFPSALSNLILSNLYLPETTSVHTRDAGRQFDELISKVPVTSVSHPNSRDPDRRLKIGFMSSDLRRHAVSSFLETVWQAISSDQYEIYAYATSPDEDDVSQRLKSYVDHWYNLSPLSAAQKADQVRTDQIDILFDLAGHTANNNLETMALKPAPVQIGWIGFSGTTGLSAMDYILGDPWVTPREDEGQYTETVWRLPHCYLSFTPPDRAIEIAETPALQNGYVTFGCFNNLSKLTAPAISLWSRILNQVPQSQLILKAKQLDDPDFKSHLLGQFDACGLDRNRIQLLQRTSGLDAHLLTYNQIDIALDPFPYCGTTTTCEALWMGVPVLTLEGQSFVSRVGASLLRNAGLEDWIAPDERDYLHKALQFSRDLDSLNAYRQATRANFMSSPAGNARLFASDFENAMRAMWKIWCGA